MLASDIAASRRFAAAASCTYVAGVVPIAQTVAPTVQIVIAAVAVAVVEAVAAEVVVNLSSAALLLLPISLLLP